MKYKCTVCGYLYDEDGIDPTTGEKNVPWEELPEEWVCPKCGASKIDFKPVKGESISDEEEDFQDEDFEDYEEEEDSDLDNF